MLFELVMVMWILLGFLMGCLVTIFAVMRMAGVSNIKTLKEGLRSLNW